MKGRRKITVCMVTSLGDAVTVPKGHQDCKVSQVLTSHHNVLVA